MPLAATVVSVLILVTCVHSGCHPGGVQVSVDVTSKSGLTRASYVFNKQQV
jgi:hypothetical protein